MLRTQLKMDEITTYHQPVLKDEVLKLLLTNERGTYVDCTIGGGGHARGILEHTKGRLIGIDSDQEALAHTRNSLSDYSQRLTLLQMRFGQLEKLPKIVKVRKFQGFLFDLGPSSHQFDSPQRGFSYLANGPLDMRMDQRGGLTAEEVINEYPRTKLALLIKEYGEEPKAKRIAKTIGYQRRRRRITSTLQLARIIAALFAPLHRIKGLSRSFQAIRIEVNDELRQLRKGLKKGWEILEVGGRICVISYHSLEDRIVKETFKGLPGGNVLTKKVIRPSLEEIKANPRARGAKLRALEKVSAK